MITKVTSANYDAYTLLFNQADTALKEFNGEPTTEFLEVATDAEFNPNIQYFNENYSPVTFEAGGSFADSEEAFEGRDLTKKWFVLNETVIYDLDTYFGRLELLSDIDYGFLRLPIDEPTFDIVDDLKNGRRVIDVPQDFAKNGISVQGDETAEILFFSIDRYYDSTDLWAEGMNYIIQWKSPSMNGVTRAFLNKDGRPFIDDDGKLYFGWPISSEMTNEPGNITFSVRIYKFSDVQNAEGKPVLTFGLNTQMATVKVNPSLTFEFKNTSEFEDAEVVDKNSTVISRIINSTVLNKGSAETAPEPTFVRNILTDDVLAQKLSEKVVTFDVYKIASGVFDPQETYYNIAHEPVVLNENIYVANIYYVKDTVSQTFYEFDADFIIDKVQQVQATVPTGIITYTAHSQASPENDGIGGSFNFVTGDSVVYERVTSPTRESNKKYYAFDNATRKFVVALDIVTEVGEEWDIQDKTSAAEDALCAYFERVSPKMEINPNNPVGCYWIVANNNEGKKALATKESYRIWIPGPVDLTDENIDDIALEKVHTDAEDEAALSVSVVDIPAHNEINYAWFKKIDGTYVNQNLTSQASQIVEYDEEELALLDEMYKVECHTSRNMEHSAVIKTKEFRITDDAHNFVFDDTPVDEAHTVDGRKAIVRHHNDEDAFKFKIDFSENLDDNEDLKMVSDTVLYRYRRRSGSDEQGNNIFYNDVAASNAEDGNHFIETTFDALADKEFVIPETGDPNADSTGTFYVEIINVVNEDFDLGALNDAADALASDISISNQTAWAPFEARIARTPYIKVNY